jgi:hypothetical protein
MLVVHLQKLNYLVERAEKDGKSYDKLSWALSYLKTLAGESPDSEDFLQWCREALEFTDGIVSETAKPEAPKRPAFTVIDGGLGDGE